MLLLLVSACIEVIGHRYSATVRARLRTPARLAELRTMRANTPFELVTTPLGELNDAAVPRPSACLPRGW